MITNTVAINWYFWPEIRCVATHFGSKHNKLAAHRSRGDIFENRKMRKALHLVWFEISSFLNSFWLIFYPSLDNNSNSLTQLQRYLCVYSRLIFPWNFFLVAKVSNYTFDTFTFFQMLSSFIPCCYVF